jgi:peptidoglycan/xylan/chitin deacetylase (PgdA/CDA1 family)
LFSGADRSRIGDFRRAVHDSDGLAIATRGERIWRPLSNPRRLQVSAFTVNGLTGFGLIQRARRFSDYEDLEANYERRPSAWIEPVGSWGNGTVRLVEIPSEEEIHDNIVAYWNPLEIYTKDQPYTFAYRILWPDDASFDELSRQRIISHTPLKREGEPDDIAKAVHFLIADAIYTGGTFRMSSSDLSAALTWQNTKRGQSTTAGMRFHFAFNGVGAANGDSLTSTATQLASNFAFINHTWDHLNLDSLSISQVLSEITQNHTVSSQFGLTPYSTLNLVTPEISGLFASNAMSALNQAGIRFIVSDTSIAGEDNPSPNAGIYNALQSAILEIPRIPTNLDYDVSDPTQWMAEYNNLYRSFWGRDLAYNEILDKESDVLVQYLLLGMNDPWMFHQPNLHFFSSGHSLLTDLLDATFTKYGRYK